MLWVLDLLFENKYEFWVFIIWVLYSIIKWKGINSVSDWFWYVSDFMHIINILSAIFIAWVVLFCIWYIFFWPALF